MVKFLNLLKANYMYILVFFGIFVLGYSVLSSNSSNKRLLGKIFGSLIIIIGCIGMYLKN